MRTGPYWIAVISHARTANVGPLSAIIGPATWYVGAGEEKAYENAGCESVVAAGRIGRARNRALADAENSGARYCVQVSDDLRALKRMVGKKAQPTSLLWAVEAIAGEMKKAKANLGGVAPTANPWYYHAEKPVSTTGFIVGDLIVVTEGSPRFDTEFDCKEDYDYTLQHLKKYGAVARANYILATFLHRTNRGGGCVPDRAQREQSAIRRLKEKWPGAIRDNPRRPNEVLMRWKAA